MESSQILSPIGIDLGGKFTGVCLSHLEAFAELPNHANTKYSVILIDHNNFQLSQAQRRATRHRVRNKKRNQFVKRVALQLFQHILSRDLNAKEETALCHYLNNRGYTYVDTDLDEYIKDETTINLLKELLPSESEHNFIDWFLQKMQSSEFRKILVSKVEEKKDDKELKNAVKNIKNFITGFEKNSVEGHRHRKVYFENIKSDITKDNQLDSIKKKIPSVCLSNLLGHLSNLQWKNLHRYLAKKPKQFDEQTFGNEFLRMLKSFRHLKGSQESLAVRNLIQQLEQSQDYISILEKTPPEITIPPYEARTNTGMEKDQSLLLNPEKLNNLYPNWRNLIPGIIDAHPFLEKDLEHTKLRDRKRIISPSKQDEKRDSYILQRYLDLNKKIDKFKIKKQLSFLGQGKQLPANLIETQKEMETHFNSSLVSVLIQIASAYNKEREDAAQGIWFDNAFSLCELSNINPPRKQKILPLLVGAILSEDFINNKDKWAKFKIFWNTHKIGRTSLKSKCKEIEEARKNSGNAFKIDYEEALNHPEHSNNKALIKIIQTIPDIIQAIQSHLGHNDSQALIYHNPFSLSQLYTILETKRDGFHKNCVAVTCENYWRSQKTEIDPEISYASRLPADSVRPFDGVLARMMQRLAYEIAMAKWEQIKHIPDNSSLLIPIYLEQNRFEFEESFKKIKGSSSDKTLEQAIEKQNIQWEEKFQRIINASMNICPYKGASIGGQGEIDHIYPRSLSKKHFGVIFNSEANLIYCSSQGNREKKEEHYLLEHLSPLYLKHQFGTDNVSDIKNFISQNVANIKKYISFHLLTPEQQKAARHALFLDYDDEAFKTITKFLMSQQKARVNGTQKFLGKQIMEFLSTLADSKQLQLEFSIKQITAEEVHDHRELLSKQEPKLVKSRQQSFPSHAIDATLTMSIGLKEFPQFSQELDNSWFINHLMPDEVHLNPVRSKEKYNKPNISSTPLFKDSLYAERFIPVWVKGETFAIGFSEKDLFEIKPSNKEKLFTLLKTYSTKNPGESLQELQAKSKAKWLYFPINKTLALEFLHHYFHKEIVTPDDTTVCHFINSLRYYTKKESITVKILKEPMPVLSVKFESSKKNVLGSFKHTIALPATKDWERLFNHPNFLALKANPAPNPKEFNEFIRKYFLSDNNPNSDIPNNGHNIKPQKHKAVRKVFSLPVIPGNAGTMMRIRRKDNKGQPLYQLQTIDDTPSMGIQINEDRLVKQEVLMDAYKTRNLSTIDGINNSEGQAYATFDNWLTLPVSTFKPEIIKLEMKPHSKTRRYIRITQSLADFIKTIDEALIIKPSDSIDDPLNMPNEIVCKNKLFGNELKPRDGKMKIVSTGKIVTYEFESDSTPQWIQTLYVTQLKKQP
ncbi:type II-B CRISPR-associated RNA-guided endonuclease Cas9/Csx12 [Legionella pneumophila serogroup 1]|nr:type II-B CRISPR-associated RNA-guided endonuclease Cas9/Csx12 [Legionella pneumophila subsp. pneumophila]HDV6745223.1 type II-B CRISPR-associated RNA-guided endonuclease Cas9/Csx12 [Legionella pneumophila]